MSWVSRNTSSSKPVRSIADNQHGLSGKCIRVQRFGVGRLFQPDQVESLAAEFLKDRGQRTMVLNVNRFIGVTGDSARTFAPPQQMIRRMPQQPAARTMRERLMLLRMGGQATTSVRGCSSGVGDLWRC